MVLVDPLVAQLSQSVRDRLREELPYMKQGRVDEVAQLYKGLIDKHVEVARPQIGESKAHIGIMDLPREIRKRIFAPLFIVHETHQSDRPNDARQVKKSTAASDGVKTILISDHSIDGEGILADAWGAQRPSVTTFTLDKHWMAQPALTQVSRAIRSETLRVYYGANTFQGIVFENDQKRLRACKAFI